MEKIKRRNLDVAKASLFEKMAERPSEKSSFVWRIAEPSFHCGHIFLKRDLRIEHVRLSKADRAAGTKHPVDLRERLIYNEVM
jgi:hypothetical protein